MADKPFDVDAAIASFLDPERKTEALASKLCHILLDEEDEDMAFSAAVAAVAVLICDPEITTENGVRNAHDFGKFVAEDLAKRWDVFLSVRAKYAAGA